jgi:hypothetical protein
MRGSVFFWMTAVTNRHRVSHPSGRGVAPHDMLGCAGQSHADEREQKFDPERSTITRPSGYHAREVCTREPR